jgi:signal transduction histidine kinase/sugar lactone lactonase YvrE
MEDHAGRLWFGTLGSGVHVHDPASNAYAHFAADPANPDSLLSNIVLAMHEDMSFNVWLATGSGLNTVDLKPHKFSLWDPGPGRMLTPGAVTAIFEDSRGNLWVGTEAGLTCLPSNMSPPVRYHHVPSDPRSLGEGTVTSILEHPSGMLWVGTLGGGLHTIDLSTGDLRTFRHNDRDSSSLSSNNVSSVYVDREGALWIGTSGGGLNMKMGDTGMFRSFLFSPRTERGLTNRVSHMLEDSRGNFWVTMVGRPLTLFHRASGNFEVIPSAPGNCNALAEDNEGNLWVATINGLYRMNVQTREVTDMSREGIFPREELKSMVLDTAGNIWLGWFGGLYRFTPPPASVPHQHYTVFDSTDGLPPGQFMHRAAWRTRSGELIFGNAYGVVRFDPSSLVINMTPPPVAITSLRVFDEPLPDASYLQSGSAIRLSHDQNLLSFQFASLDLTRPSKNKYLYTLEGFDNRWTSAEGHPTVRYTNLHPGEYVFRVRGANADGVWNEAGSSVTLTILPPFWATWWFRAVAIIIAVAGLYGMHRYRVEQLLTMERIRTHIAMGLHDDVGADLTRITLFSNAARQRLGDEGKADPQLLSLLGDITSISREAVDSMADIVWAVNPKNDSFDQLVIRMKTYAARLLEAHGIDYEVVFPESIASLRVPLEFRRNMFLIFKEALSNCVRHSKANTVRIGISREKETLVMEIADNGKGFHKEQVRGNGLRNMQRRAEELHGRLEIVSGESSGGTSVILRATPA